MYTLIYPTESEFFMSKDYFALYDALLTGVDSTSPVLSTAMGGTVVSG